MLAFSGPEYNTLSLFLSVFCTECTDGFYGENCIQPCGKCEGGGAMCDKKTGQCVRCIPGFSGQKCEQGRSQ